jgi:hypothetical protein
MYTSQQIKKIKECNIDLKKLSIRSTLHYINISTDIKGIINKYCGYSSPKLYELYKLSRYKCNTCFKFLYLTNFYYSSFNFECICASCYSGSRYIIYEYRKGIDLYYKIFNLLNSKKSKCSICHINSDLSLISPFNNLEKRTISLCSLCYNEVFLKLFNSNIFRVVK